MAPEADAVADAEGDSDGDALADPPAEGDTDGAAEADALGLADEADEDAVGDPVTRAASSSDALPAHPASRAADVRTMRIRGRRTQRS